MEYFPSPDHLRHASHPLDKDHTSGRRRESLHAFRPLSTRIPAGPAQDFGQDTNRNPGRTKVGLPTRTPTTSPRKDARKARKRPKKGPKRPRRARPARPHKAPKERPEEATQGHQKPTANQPPPQEPTSNQPTARKARKGPQEATDRASRARPPPHRRGQGKAQERPEKDHNERPNPCRLWLPCRVESCRTVSLDKPGVCVVYWL